VVIWKMLVLGGAISVIFTFLFGARTFRIHMAITGLIAATIGLVFVLIITMDFPFRGTVSVTSDSFLNVQQSAAGALAALPHH
jgi:ABC-type branched-subunit amino acid transport system permease subunit